MKALSEVEHVMSSHYTIKVLTVLGAGRCESYFDSCVGTSMVKGIGLSVNRTPDTLS